MLLAQFVRYYPVVLTLCLQFLAFKFVVCLVLKLRFLSAVGLLCVVIFLFLGSTFLGFLGGGDWLGKDFVCFCFILFVLSEILFFFSFFWGFFHFGLTPASNTGRSPFFGVMSVASFGIPLLNTFILLSSRVTVTWSHKRVSIGFSLFWPILLSIVLGCVFLCFQWIEYSLSNIMLSDGVFRGGFYMLTGFHGFHVLLGVLLFVGVLCLDWREHNSWASFQCVSWYWHFVDVVWLFLFCIVYVWSSGV